jgi:DGQHR domain-containing protein
MLTDKQTISLPAIEITQGGGRKIYAFAVDGKKLHSFAQVSRLGRGIDERVSGYQRPEVLSHIAEIRSYIESESALLPNAIVIAFDSSVRFEPLDASNPVGMPRHGHLIISLSNGENQTKVGWIVDGQQRSAAIRDARVVAFPIIATGFIADSVSVQREQFILVNSTKPLPKGLIYELLPATDTQMASQFEKRRFPAYLLDRLNYDSQSPLHLSIQTPTNPYLDSSIKNRRGVFGRPSTIGSFSSTLDKNEVRGFIKDNSILRMLDNSLNDGALYRCRLQFSENEQTEAMLEMLFRYWSAVVEVFEHAWKKHPSKSRLTHGIGIVSLGHLMDAIVDRYRLTGFPTREQFVSDLKPLAPYCSWTDGYWNFSSVNQRRWNEVQNTSKDIQMVSNYLLVQYKKVVWSK